MAIEFMPSSGEDGNRARVAAEVRAALARVRIPVSRVAEQLGNTTSRAYWSRRVNGETPLDIDDLSAIAALTGTSIVDLVRTTESPSPSPSRPGSGAGIRTIYFMGEEVGPAGFEPTTSTVEAPRFTPVIVGDWEDELEDEPEQLAPIVSMLSRRSYAPAESKAAKQPAHA